MSCDKFFSSLSMLKCWWTYLIWKQLLSVNCSLSFYCSSCCAIECIRARMVKKEEKKVGVNRCLIVSYDDIIYSDWTFIIEFLSSLFLLSLFIEKSKYSVQLLLLSTSTNTFSRHKEERILIHSFIHSFCRFLWVNVFSSSQ